MQKSIRANFILYSIKEVLTIIVPLLTYPYVSRKLGAESLGIANFASSIVAYFKLFSALGISSYAVREGAKWRENRQEFSDFANEIFFLNLISMMVSVTGCVCAIFLVEKIEVGVALIYSITIPLTTIGVEWIYIIYEDFIYITIRTIVVQVVSVVATFCAINSSDDYFLYAAIAVLSGGGASIFNFVHSKKYVDWNLQSVNIKNVFRRLKPVLTIFGMTIAAEIYLNCYLQK